MQQHAVTDDFMYYGGSLESAPRPMPPACSPPAAQRLHARAHQPASRLHEHSRRRTSPRSPATPRGRPFGAAASCGPSSRRHPSASPGCPVPIPPESAAASSPVIALSLSRKPCRFASGPRPQHDRVAVALDESHDIAPGRTVHSRAVKPLETPRESRPPGSVPRRTYAYRLRELLGAAARFGTILAPRAEPEHHRANPPLVRPPRGPRGAGGRQVGARKLHTLRVRMSGHSLFLGSSHQSPRALGRRAAPPVPDLAHRCELRHPLVDASSRCT